MTDAHDNAHKDARELLAAIDAWQAADAAYQVALDIVDEAIAAGQATTELFAMRLSKRADLVAAVPDFVRRSTPDDMPSHHLFTAFTTLARAYRTLEAERDAAVAKIAAVENDLLSTMQCLSNIADNAPKAEPQSNIPQPRAYAQVHGFWSAGQLARRLVGRIVAERATLTGESE